MTKIITACGAGQTITAAALDVPQVHIANVSSGLDETVAKTDIDDAGTIDGTEVAAMLSADHVVVNAIAAKVNAVIAALEAAGVLASS